MAVPHRTPVLSVATVLSRNASRQGSCCGLCNSMLGRFEMVEHSPSDVPAEPASPLICRLCMEFIEPQHTNCVNVHYQSFWCITNWCITNSSCVDVALQVRQTLNSVLANMLGLAPLVGRLNDEVGRGAAADGCVRVRAQLLGLWIGLAGSSS